VASYRLYRIGPNERLLPPEVLACRSDAEAAAVAARMLAGRAGELWLGGRLVGRFSKLGVFSPAG
jgi:hypothetical protein